MLMQVYRKKPPYFAKVWLEERAYTVDEIGEFIEWCIDRDLQVEEMCDYYGWIIPLKSDALAVEFKIRWCV